MCQHSQFPSCLTFLELELFHSLLWFSAIFILPVIPSWISFLSSTSEHYILICIDHLHLAVHHRQLRTIFPKLNSWSSFSQPCPHRGKPTKKKKKKEKSPMLHAQILSLTTQELKNPFGSSSKHVSVDNWLSSHSRGLNWKPNYLSPWKVYAIFKISEPQFRSYGSIYQLVISLKRTGCWERLKTKGEGGGRGWDG